VQGNVCSSKVLLGTRTVEHVSFDGLGGSGPPQLSGIFWGRTGRSVAGAFRRAEDLTWTSFVTVDVKFVLLFIRRTSVTL
jgi:hypothetical protein